MLTTQHIPSDESAFELSEPMLKQLYKNIGRHIDMFDFSKVFEMLEETKKFKIPDTHKETLDKIDSLMNDLDVDAIKEILEKT